MVMTYYFELCKDCEYLYHCFGEIAEKIKNDEADDMYLMHGRCNNFYPEMLS